MSKYDNWEQLAYEMENDFNRYPLPIEFDPGAEQRELYRRHLRIKAIAKRWFSIFKTFRLFPGKKCVHSYSGHTCDEVSVIWVAPGIAYVKGVDEIEFHCKPSDLHPLSTKELFKS